MKKSAFLNLETENVGALEDSQVGLGYTNRVNEITVDFYQPPDSVGHEGVLSWSPLSNLFSPFGARFSLRGGASGTDISRRDVAKVLFKPLRYAVYGYTLAGWQKLDVVTNGKDVVDDGSNWLKFERGKEVDYVAVFIENTSNKRNFDFTHGIGADRTDKYFLFDVETMQSIGGGGGY